jgi:hypothetical protein
MIIIDNTIQKCISRLQQLYIMPCFLANCKDARYGFSHIKIVLLGVCALAYPK